MLLESIGHLSHLKSSESFKQTGGRGAFNSISSTPSTRSDYIKNHLDTSHPKRKHFGKATIPKIIS